MTAVEHRDRLRRLDIAQHDDAADIRQAACRVFGYHAKPFHAGDRRRFQSPEHGLEEMSDTHRHPCLVADPGRTAAIGGKGALDRRDQVERRRQRGRDIGARQIKQAVAPAIARLCHMATLPNSPTHVNSLTFFRYSLRPLSRIVLRS